ncbi:Na+/H+ antiporter subunit E [Pseudanabaena sp. FACHB-1277]|uniref:Na+/H+ antiporter subunit E n=1 Tax=Pseudanabaena cinerea FACHB-1277 TaxID=2949581 RepID=A0A926UXZ9_9CYAN|nr:Na+/H+ antiporter subunit E [Pseudanabaena cinerea]MBD2152037.1 Na+/H+ antiporter subunit E [Pseudanabaena cinerea FACHB-1277]
MIGQFILRIVIWFLLTANFTITNIIIGISICLLMPHYHTESFRIKDVVQGIQRIIVAVPQAYIEAIAMIWQPHNHEEVTMEEAQNRRSAALVFLDIFLITFTPKTIVLKHRQDGWYDIHRVVRRISKRQNP